MAPHKDCEAGQCGVSGRPLLEEEQYKYMRLREAVISIGQKVNIYGGIMEFDYPRKTRGSDVTCTMTLHDMSYPTGLRVVVFAPSLDLLPHVKAVGNIIRFHRVEMTIYNKNPQAIAKILKPSQFLLFSGSDSDDHQPYQQSSKNYTIDKNDGKILNLFRQWHRNLPIEPVARNEEIQAVEGSKHGVFSPNQYITQIKGLTDGASFDLLCKILLVDAGDEDHAFTIYVWDGTDVPLTLVGAPSGEVLPDSKISMTCPVRTAMRDFPLLGSVLPLVPETSDLDLPLQLPAAGSWVHFRNLRCSLSNGMYKGVWTLKSKLISTLADSSLVQTYLRAYQERESWDMGHLPSWCPKPVQSITVTDYEHVRYSTLREVLLHSEVTYKFRCLVRVVATWPPNFVDFSSVVEDEVGVDESVESTEERPYAYAVRFTLEDPTAQLQAYLSGEDGVKFFNGHPAKDLHSQGATVGALERKVKRLLGIADDGTAEWRNPPWIKCCLKSYYLSKEHPWDTRRFRIFGTTLPG